MFVCLLACLLVCLFVCLFACLFVCLLVGWVVVCFKTTLIIYGTLSREHIIPVIKGLALFVVSLTVVYIYYASNKFYKVFSRIHI